MVKVLPGASRRRARFPLRVPAAAVLAAAVALAAVPSVSSAAPAGRSRPGRISVIDRQAGVDLMTPTPPEQGDTTIEPSISVNPENPKNAVAVYQEGRVDGGGDQDNGYATTFNGGRSWIYGDLPGLTLDVGGTWERASDAVVAFGPGGVVYANSLVFDDGSSGGDPNRSGLAVNVSHDGGRTWDQPVVFVDDTNGGLNDKNWIVVDTSDAPGHHLGRVYVVWDTLAPMWAIYSDDEGETWSGRSVIWPGQGIGALPVVTPNGDLAVAFTGLVPQDEDSPGGAPGLLGAGDNPNQPGAPGAPTLDNILVSVAHGAGSVPTGAPLVFAPPVKVADSQSNDVRQLRDGGLIDAAVNPVSGRIYVGWEDGRFRTDSVNDAVVAWSDDEGLTWSPVTRVNPGPTDDWVDHWNTVVGVGPDGVLHVSYRQRQEAADIADASWNVDTYYQRSTDGGATFGAPVKVNSVQTDLRYAAFSRNSAFLGDYNDLAAAPGYVYIVRCEALPLPGDPPPFPPTTVHHQSTWVAVVRSR